MNIEFHYYITYFLAKEAGFLPQHAEILAYSSQFVDTSIHKFEISSQGSIYSIEPTQNYGFWAKDFAYSAYLPFHFYPGRAEKNWFAVKANSRAVKDLLIHALKQKNLYKMGIALHTFADSWAHDGYSGIIQKWNTVSESSPLPPIGHAQAGKKPDLLEERSPKGMATSNLEKYIAAAKKTYRYLCLYNGTSYEDEDLQIETLKLVWMTSTGKIKPLRERISDYSIELAVPPFDRMLWYQQALIDPPKPGDDFAGFDKLLWARDHILGKPLGIRRLKAKDEFQHSHLYKWNEAAKYQRTWALSEIKKHQLEIPWEQWP
jgi:hypothetical protein